MKFNQVTTPVKDLQIWNANSEGFSFVISYETPNGPGLHGRPGFVVSWRPLLQNKPAIKVGGSPFKTFEEAERACEIVREHLTRLP